MNNLDTIRYLNKLYKSNFKKNNNCTKEVIVSLSEKNFLKNLVKNNTEKYIFLQKHSGPYCRKLEKEVSLSKDEISSIYKKNVKKGIRKIDIDTFSSVYFTWIKYNNLTDEMHQKFNRAVLIPIHKKDDIDNPKNYRYLYNFSNIIKLLDKIWANNICQELTGKLDGDKYLSYHIRGGFNENMKTKASKFTNSLDNKIMLDFEKAFDNVSFFSIKHLLKDFLIRKLGIDKGIKYFKQYFNIITNSSIYFNKIKIKRNKGIPTGLPSSNLIFTAIINQIFYVYTKYFPDFLKYFNYNVYVDDIAIDILNNKINIKKYLDPLLSIFKYYKFKCNFNKCLISKNISFNYPKFNKITTNTKYLGIYFSRDISEYFKLIIDEFNKKNNLECKNVYEMMKKKRKSSIGFLLFKLEPFKLSKI